MVSLPIAMARGSASGLTSPAAEREYNFCDLFIAAVVAAASRPVNRRMSGVFVPKSNQRFHGESSSAIDKRTVLVESRDGAKICILVDGANWNCGHQSRPCAGCRAGFVPFFIQRDQLFPSPASGDQFRHPQRCTEHAGESDVLGVPRNCLWPLATRPMDFPLLRTSSVR